MCREKLAGALGITSQRSLRGANVRYLCNNQHCDVIFIFFLLKVYKSNFCNVLNAVTLYIGGNNSGVQKLFL
jgi:hypothetical protein